MRMNALIALVLMVFMFPCLAGAQQQWDEKFSRVRMSALDLEEWKIVPAAEAGNIGKTLDRELANIDQVQQKFSTREWLSSVIPTIYQDLSGTIEERNNAWGERYLGLVEAFSDAQSNYNTYKEKFNTLLNRLQGYSDLQRQNASIREVYLQNLKGIPSYVLVVGVKSWRASEGKSVDEVFADMLSKGRCFVKRSGNSSLVFSDTRTENFRLKRDVVREYKGGAIDEVETDPIRSQIEEALIVAQKFRVLPVFYSEQEGADEGEAEGQDTDCPQGDVDFFIVKGGLPAMAIQAANEGKLINALARIFQAEPQEIKGEIPGSLWTSLEDFSKVVGEKNEASFKKIETFDENYTAKIMQVDANLLAKESEIKESLGDIDKIVNKGAPGAAGAIREAAEGLVARMQEDATGATINVEQAITLASRRATKLFGDAKDKASSDLATTLDERVWTLVTTEYEYLSTGSKPQAFTKQILGEAMDKLMERKQRLMAYEMTVVVDGKLTTRKANQYYDEGQVVRYFVSPSIVANSNSDGGEAGNKMSLLLGLQVRYKKLPDGLAAAPVAPVVLQGGGGASPGDAQGDHGGGGPAPLVGGDKTFQAGGLTWYVGNACGVFENIESKLPPGYRLPKRSEIVMLRGVLLEDERLLNRHAQLMQPGREVWLNERSSMTGQRYTYDLNSNNSGRHDEQTYDGCVIGVKN